MNTQNGMSQQSMTEVKQSARRLRKQFLTYQLDDADVAMLRKDFITVEQGKRYNNIGDKAFIRLARKAGAVYKIGKAVRINRHVLEAYGNNTAERCKIPVELMV